MPVEQSKWLREHNIKWARMIAAGKMYYYPRWYSYPNQTLWAMAWWQGGP